MKTVSGDIETRAELENRMAKLQRDATGSRTLLLEAVNDFKVSLKPINLGRQVLNGVTKTGNREQLIGTSVSLSASVIGKKILFPRKKGFFNKLIGHVIQTLMSRLIAGKRILKAVPRSGEIAINPK